MKMQMHILFDMEAINDYNISFYQNRIAAYSQRH
jgi:hypothetical protein